ncbi:MAG: hypothetical protein A2381_13335 [Bdellovibrionales bacterium RIFOXYB1_FULL_37_110]|nr:MAG: hypothetical protein A2181_02660 [Bdellovibrionales bacterium RIFOXYA1_FULL_38_20]OFZ51685.1 MAG: hypothetical protein A2417_12995 [Bdellovibrionales bacterium RIFOXYC1_FULL_37_79]OFZ60512.1 MAG: hypothetical protein A2381_13335 [Bdellovibrionales bacterium RIFOXYB1_FULL_37_110]OFZ65086.1 MAG: hypothetical protein A2577_09600 [Bdellovibrionales bacterium RIFOXYD1_FULL_36_51]
MSKKKTVLIVDDDQDIRDVLSIFLKDKDYYVISAESPSISLRLLQELKIDLLISDLAMPGMNGFDFIKLVCLTLEEKDRPKIIIYTGYKDMLASEPTFQNVDKVIDKSTNIREVIQEITALLET